MTRTSSLALILTVLSSVIWIGCRAEQSAVSPLEEDREPVIFAVSYALQHLTQEIVGDWVTVGMPDFGDRSPRHWSPDTETIRLLQRADLIVVNGRGVQIAEWLDTITVSPNRICLTADGIRLTDFIMIRDAPTHSHGPLGEHSHSNVIATTWLDPLVARDQMEVVLERLCELFPDRASEFRNNYRELEQRLVDLAEEISQFQSDLEGRQVLSSEPSFKYLLRRVGVEDQHHFWSQEDAPITEELYAAFDERRDPEVRIMLWPHDPPDDVQQQLSERGITVVQIDLLIAPPTDGDYASSLIDSLERLHQALHAGED